MAVKAEIHISVRNLVEFVLRSGSIDNRKAAMPENAMQEGVTINNARLLFALDGNSAKIPDGFMQTVTVKAFTKAA